MSLNPLTRMRERDALALMSPAVCVPPTRADAPGQCRADEPDSGWTVRVHIEGPGTFATMSCEVPYGIVEIHGFDALEEAGHDAIGRLVSDLRCEDLERDGTWVH